MATKNDIYYRAYTNGQIHLTLASFDHKLCLCDWSDSVKFESGIRKLTRLLRGKLVNADALEDPVLDKASLQLDEYFAGKRKEFDVPLMILGSEFHCKAMSMLQSIPYGKVTTYKELADALIESNKMSQCIGSCIGSNLLSIFIPCHRVVSKEFHNGGYRGGIRIKEHLLVHESQYSRE
ncbi:MAG: methylated-DNA--[protein]-cysteine S-methyltransferase [Prevotella sp.]|nr:methylated-DNA--[protein]-cysteine S-methyltransferase [Bacteroides sp.]MCM1366230.1 methylated-DNA--[protein]-cysteine S-methyltransferase [Prevotella sp.]MCM1436365.1 methylated-DNA--[protein]-cysteine S-methyltransferase [Prevotella sp.]